MITPGPIQKHTSQTHLIEILSSLLSKHTGGILHHIRNTHPDPLPEDPCDLISDLIAALHDIAPPYLFFGDNPDVPGQLGFWLDPPCIEEDIAADILLSTRTLADIPPDYTGPVIVEPDPRAPTDNKRWYGIHMVSYSC